MLNLAIQIGVVTRDPVVGEQKDGTPVAEWGLAVDRKYFKAGGQGMHEETLFLSVKTYGRHIESVVVPWVKKGRWVMVEGFLRYYIVEKKTCLVTETIKFMDGPGGGDG